MDLVETAPDFTDGSMLALYPPHDLAKALAVPGGLPPEDLHVTVAYTGKAADVDAEAFRTAAKTLTDRDPIEATVSGHARFTGGQDGDVIVALIDSAALEDLRRDTLAELADRGIAVPRDHGYTAHMTISYLPADADSPVDRLENRDVTFTSLAAVHGADRTDFPFAARSAEKAPNATHPIVPYARTAYAQGWAASGGPMTDRVKAGCVAAVDHAIDHADDPNILEVALHLGALEGVWAWVYQRREALIAQHTTEVLKVWQHLTRNLDIGGLVDQARVHALPGAPKPDVLARVTADANRTLLTMLLDPDYRGLLDVVGDALRAAKAEGRAGALAVAAEQRPSESRAHTPPSGFAFDVAFDHAYTALDNQAWAAAPWIDRILKGNAADVGHALADLMAEEAPYNDMVAAVRELTGGGARAVSSFIDMAMSMAANQGAVDLYRSEGIAEYDVLTAGDGRVCSRCDDAEAGNSYPVNQPPPVSLHPTCRCAVAATSPLPGSAYSPYLPEEA